MKKKIAALLALVMLMASSTVMAFPDCDDKDVLELAELGVLSGDDEGKFNPDNYLSRAEFSKILAVCTGMEENADYSELSRSFTDLSNGHWASDYIGYCVMNKVIEGFDDGTFRPGDKLTYAQIIKMCLTSEGYGVFVQKTQPWYVGWMNAAMEYGLTEIENYDADRAVTRLETAKIINKAINLPLCMSVGYERSDAGVFEPVYKIQDGKDGEFQSLYTKYLSK